MIALFTLVRPGSVTPTLVCAIMTFSQVGNSSIDLSLSRCTDWRWTASDDLGGSGQKAIFVPLVTATALPAFPADVAIETSKLCKNNGREVRYQNSALHGQLELQSVSTG